MTRNFKLKNSANDYRGYILLKITKVTILLLDHRLHEEEE